MKRWCLDCDNLSVSIIDKFCNRCGGKNFTDDWPRCPDCNSISNIKDQFCSMCGHSLSLSEKPLLSSKKRIKWFERILIWKR